MQDCPRVPAAWLQYSKCSVNAYHTTSQVQPHYHVLPSWGPQDTAAILNCTPLHIPDQASGTRPPAFKSQLQLLKSCVTRASHLVMLNLSLPLCKMGIITVSTLKGCCWELNKLIQIKCLQQCLTNRKHKSYNYHHLPIRPSVHTSFSDLSVFFS